MSQNPAHAHRRALSPPAVTRFQLITPAAAETVFAPPYVPARSERLRYTRRPPQPVSYTQFPEPVRQQPTALPPPARSAEPPSSPVAEEPLGPTRPPPPREAPGTWREIIARVDVGDAGEAVQPETRASEGAADTRPPAAPREPPPDVPERAPPQPEQPAPLSEPEELGAPGEPVPWEVEAFTAPGYTAPRTVEPIEEIGELVLDQVVPPDGGTAGEEETARPTRPAADRPERTDFPLDAFIVPGGTQRMPAGYETEVAQLVARRLDDLAQQLRSDGLAALGHAHDVDELSRVFAAIIAGYVARDA